MSMSLVVFCTETIILLEVHLSYVTSCLSFGWSVSYTRTWSVLISPSPIIRPWTDTQIRWRYSPKMDYLGCLSFPLVSLHAKATQAITEKWASNKNDFRPNRLIVNNQIGLPKNIKNERKLPQTLTMITNLIFYICFNVLCFYRYVELKIFQHFYKIRNNIFFLRRLLPHVANISNVINLNIFMSHDISFIFTFD